jgi:hypothetical protein
MINYLKKIRLSVIFIFLIFFFSLFPPFLAKANILVDALYAVLLTIPAFILVIILAVSQAVAFLMGIILNWTINPNLIPYSYTRPCPSPQEIGTGCNPIITVGLQITQGLVNMILVIILVYAAVSIALRLGGENEAKKIFVRLIIVALLVNFAPVLVGLIVDAANIVMNFFLEPLNTRVGIAGILNQSSTYMDILSSAISLGTDIRERLGLLAAGVGAIIINFAIAGAFLIYAGIFLFRYLAIWILTILSPLAFVAWIVPYTKKIWDMWWNNLIQWSIIGIPIAFFLYLALGSFTAINEAFRVRLSGPLPPEEIGVIARLIPYAIVVIFLFLGFIIGLVTSAMGATAVINFTKNTNKKAGQLMGDVARGIPYVRKTEEKLRRGLERIPLVNRIPGLRPGTFERQEITAYGVAMKRLEEIPNTYQGNEALLRIAKSRALTLQGRYEKAAAIELLAKRKSLNLTNDEAENLIPQAQYYGADIKTIYQARPDFTPYLTKTVTKIDPQTGKTKKEQEPMSIEEVVNQTTAKDFWQNVQKEALKNEMVVFQVMLDESKLKASHKQPPAIKKEFKETLLKVYNGIQNQTTQKKIEPFIKRISTDPSWQ